jgi:prepilin-type processing-associated H-X9-DG protein
VVIAIIAVLIGLLLPAVQKVREAAARMKCQNNLKQLALASHMYQDTNKKLPPGWVTSTAGAPSPGWSWAIVILPFIEQQQLFTLLNPDLITPNGPPGSGTVYSNGQIALQLRQNVYRCPSDPGPDINPVFANYGMNNYVINREVVGPGRLDGNNNNQNGLAVETIIDGSSNTILFGERDSVHNVAAVWIRASQSSCSFEGRPGRGINIVNVPLTTGVCERLGFNSLHTNGANFAFADGSVHYVAQGVSADQSFDACAFPAATGNFVLQNLIHPQDGNAIGNY